jgi:recombination associated protein RdgC
VGALAGPLTVAKLTVRGELPDDFRDTFIEHIQLRVFEPLTPDEEIEERMGWCVVGSPLNLELGHENVFYNSYLNLGLRIDKWQLPTTLLQAQYEGALRERLEKSGKERLTKTEKDELKLRIASRLKKKLIPTMKHFDFVWNLDTGIAYFWSQSPRAIDMLSVLFEQTFGLELALHSPYFAATELDLTKRERKALDLVDPTPFHGAKKKLDMPEKRDAEEEG